MNDTNAITINVGINFSTWAVATDLRLDYARGTYTFELKGPRYSGTFERRFNPQDTGELRRLFGDELTDRAIQAWREYHASPWTDEEILW